MIQLPFRVQGVWALEGILPGVPRVTVRDMYVSPLVILASFTLGGRRLAGLLGLVWVALYVRDWEPPDLAMSKIVVAVVLPAAGFGLLTPAATDGAKSMAGTNSVAGASSGAGAREHGAAVVLALWFSGPLPWFTYQSIVVLVPVAAAFVFLPVAPAFAIGATLAWSVPHLWIYGGESIWTIVLLAFTPVSIALVAVARRAAIRGDN